MRRWVRQWVVVATMMLSMWSMQEQAVMGQTQAKRPITVDDLFQFKRVAEPQISPDGMWVIYQQADVDVAANKSTTSLWLADARGANPPRKLTNPIGKSDRHPRWHPDSKQILFESTRGGDSQLWRISIEGGEATQITKLSTGASTGLWSADGKRIAFVSAIYPQFSQLPADESDAKNKELAAQIEANPVKARSYNKLFYRHWDSLVEDKRQHLFVCNADGTECRDVTPGDRDAYPTSSTFSVGDDFTFSPDSKSLIFTAVPAENEAWSTNHDLCRANIEQPSTSWPSLTSGNLAADGMPRFSPDGKRLAYRAQNVAGYEADRWQLMVVDCNPDGTFAGKPASLTQELDRSCDELLWVSNDLLLFSVEQQASKTIYAVDRRGGEVMATEIPAGQLSALSVAANQLVFQRAQMHHPAEAFIVPIGIAGQTKQGQPPIDLSASPRQVSHGNDELYASVDLPRPESIEVPGAGGTPMQMWILKPPGFDPNKKWPVAYLVHGGPQGAWEDGWSFRWCPQVWAAQGYVVALPNPRGSTGFGQQYVREISGDWGGKCYQDLIAGADYLAKQPWVDADRMGAAGASFGGYMMNWFAVSTDRFKCLITHCSVWNFESMWGTTDELWFDEFEHGGLPWEKEEHYRQFSPHRLAGNLGKYKTPMLVIHNDLDFRCPIGQGQELFTALQRQGVPSRFVNFPDEGHWVSKPANSRHWHHEVFAWLTSHVPPGGR
jgi:dipeptidyl aminopeptidase/acylaminoacyl peptidase